MNPKELAAVFNKVWTKLFNPRSGCPDVELGYVSDVLAQLLVEEGYGEKLDDVERWVLAKVAVEGYGHPASLGMAYADRVPYYSDEKDEQGYPKPRPYEEREQEQAAAMAEAEKATLNLVENKLLVEREGKVYLP